MTAAKGRQKRRPKKRVAGAQRDQHESAFGAILSKLVTRIPGARGAALVDSEGETVDYAGRANPFDVKVAAAHWRIVLDEARETRGLRDVRSIAVRATRTSYLVQVLPEGYALVVVMVRSAGFSGWQRDATEMPPKWFPVTVLRDERRRPAAVRADGRLHPLEILGTLQAGLSSRERAWRIRFESGLEATLVREPGGACYLDEKLGREQMH